VGVVGAFGLYFNDESTRGIKSDSGQLKPVRQPLDERAETNSLDNPFD
jgi:hypothetical protein